MTAQRMRQHLGAVVWHAREAIDEAPRGDLIPDVVHEIAVNGMHIAIDEGHIAEAADRDTHILPDVVKQAKQR